MGTEIDRLLTVDEALHAIRERAAHLKPRPCVLAEALGCVLAEDVTADLDLPPFDKALVDGYAVRASDLVAGECRLAVGEEIVAGRTPTRALAPGEAAAIMTGAPLPPDADAVIMVEKTRRDGADVLLEGGLVRPGQNRLLRGREMRAGDVVLRKGEPLNAPKLGLLASVGRAKVLVFPRPRVAIVPTGDELVEPDVVPGPGQIRNSNAVMLQALTGATGAEVRTFPIAPDEPAGLRSLLERGLNFDVLTITGGVSAGNRDLVPEALASLGVTRVFHKVRVKPGKPLWFGVGPPRGDAPGALVFGLPGNPVSGIVGFLLFVRPALLALASQRAESLPLMSRRRLARAFVHSSDRPTYFPARLSAESAAAEAAIEPLDWAGSADLRTVAQADGFAVFAAGDRHYQAGEVVEFLHLG
ncbi:molybdopterin molybdochelatase [Singulisphaera sp. GP187]|uniref:molybdopterin molybdotransferase MoeA n=1 Tax=Singulisphaera sp. GP187 TaxID=1882752 RepID=UPI00092662E4|nr:gephyrin-like molybdotransferase Glp [Singulisphaera sp. GP187]SIO14164.1 molybdopterin molybdochelatase [Singulisphaera sp. GP187]